MGEMLVCSVEFGLNEIYTLRSVVWWVLYIREDAKKMTNKLGLS